MIDQPIPDYFVYGQAARALAVGFMHVERISERYYLHRGIVPAHKHSSMAQLTLWIKGGGTYFIEDQSWTFSAPAASLVLSDTVHGFSVRLGADAIVLSIENSMLGQIITRDLANELGSMFASSPKSKPEWIALGNAMEALEAEYRNQPPHWPHMMAQIAGTALIVTARIADKKRRLLAPATSQPLAQRLRRIVETHFRENWKIERIVGELGTTEHVLERTCKMAFSCSVKKLIVERRLLEAKRLLKFTVRPVEDIAYELGFKDSAYFSREFKKRTDLAPGHWRRTFAT